MTRIYPVNSKDSHPGPLFLRRSSVKRSPRRPLITMRHTPSELTGYGHDEASNAVNSVLALASADRRAPLIARLSGVLQDASNPHRLQCILPILVTF
jgi:Protocatechuate 3,4-dioxygenase beta subunit N terminal